jgi:hypothetical protein
VQLPASRAQLQGLASWEDHGEFRVREFADLPVPQLINKVLQFIRQLHRRERSGTKLDDGGKDLAFALSTPQRCDVDVVEAASRDGVSHGLQPHTLAP